MFNTFLLGLAGGMLVVLATGRPDQISWRFLRLVAMLTFAMVAVVIVQAWSPRRGPWVTFFPQGALASANALGACLLIGLAPLAKRWSGWFRGVAGAAGAAGLVAAALSGASRTAAPENTTMLILLVPVSFVLGSFLLGSITVAWLLGHAYLTASRMTLAPLRHFSRVLSWAVLVRGTFLFASLGVAYAFRNGSGLDVWTDLRSAWLIVLLRAGVGVVALAVFAYLVRACVRVRATQSATGILYFGSVFAYIGELASQHLLLECGWPL